jgi:hypothetical protein
MYITLILFLDILSNWKNIISHTSKLFLLESYKSVDLIGPAFNRLSEGLFLLIIIFPLLRFIVFDFFGREVNGSGAQFIISLYVVITQSILSAVVLAAIKFNNLFGMLACPPKFNFLILKKLNVLSRWITYRIFDYSFFTCLKNLQNFYSVGVNPDTLEFYNFAAKRPDVNYMLKGKIYFSTSCCVQDLVDSNNLKSPKVKPLNSNWITGFTDGDGSFMVSVIKSKDRALGWRVTPIFSIKLSDKNQEILINIKSFFGVGSIVFNQTSGVAIYSVKSVLDIYSVIIPHFCKYPLLTQKQADFFLFKNIIELIIKKEHLTPLGLKKILEYKNVLNKGLSFELTDSFPEINLIERPTVLLPENLDVNWFVGFIDAARGSCFYVNISKSATKLEYSLHFYFQITQHMREVRLFNFIKKWLGCGYVYELPKETKVNFIITSFKDIVKILVPILNEYPLQGVKKLNCDDFMTIVKLVENKKHLSPEDVDKIRQIKFGIPTGIRARNLNLIENNISTDLHPVDVTKGALRTKKERVKGSLTLIQKREFHCNRIRANTRIGPHNLDIFSNIFGSLLGLNTKTRLSTNVFKFMLCTNYRRSLSIQSKTK